jgi:hypothetical protein
MRFEIALVFLRVKTSMCLKGANLDNFLNTTNVF